MSSARDASRPWWPEAHETRRGQSREAAGSVIEVVNDGLQDGVAGFGRHAENGRAGIDPAPRVAEVSAGAASPESSPAWAASGPYRSGWRRGRTPR